MGGNYAPTFGPIMKAKKAGYALTLHLDSKTHNYIDEFSTSNFVALTYPGKVYAFLHEFVNIGIDFNVE